MAVSGTRTSPTTPWPFSCAAPSAGLASSTEKRSMLRLTHGGSSSTPNRRASSAAAPRPYWIEPPVLSTSAKKLAVVEGFTFKTRLPEDVSCHGQRMPVQVQVTDVLKQETDERVALASSPTVTCAGFADGALHDVAARKSTAGQGAAEAL